MDMADRRMELILMCPLSKVLIYSFAACIFVSCFQGVLSIQVTLSSSTSPAVLGNSYFLYCQYALHGTESLTGITLYRKRSDDAYFVKIVTFQQPGNGIPIIYYDTTLENRTVAINPTNELHRATLEFNEVKCSDKAAYRWDVLYNNGEYLTQPELTSIDVKAKTSFNPDGDGSLTYATDVNYKEGDDITFTCHGDVGSLLTGWMTWYYYINSAETNVTTHAIQNSPVPITSACTSTRTSTLTLRLEKELNGFEVRCTVNQDTLTAEGDGYRQTQPIAVHYAPRVNPISPLPQYEVGTSEVTLTCSGDGNPPPTYSWVLADNSEQDGPTLKLQNLQLDMMGVYTCVATNDFYGQNYTANKTVNIEVVEAGVLSIQVTLSSSTSPAVLGNSYFLYCQYALHGTESLTGITLYRKRSDDADFVKIVTFQQPGNGIPIIYYDTTLENRTVAINPTNELHRATLEFNEVKCSDKAAYRWDVPYMYTNGEVMTQSELTSIDVKAETSFNTDGSLTYATDVNYEGDDITFTCHGDVGSLPTGWMAWYYYINSAETNVTTHAIQNSPVPNTPACTSTRTSTLTLRLEKEFDGFEVRCTVNQDTLTAEGDGHIQTQPIAVQYAANAGAIAGGVVGAVVAIVIIVLLAYFLWYRRRSGGDTCFKKKGITYRDHTYTNEVETNVTRHEMSQARAASTAQDEGQAAALPYASLATTRVTTSTMYNALNITETGRVGDTTRDGSVAGPYETLEPRQGENAPFYEELRSRDLPEIPTGQELENERESSGDEELERLKREVANVKDKTRRLKLEQEKERLRAELEQRNKELAHIMNRDDPMMEYENVKIK